MLYKEDWREAQERLKAWWDGEVIDRVAAQVFAPLEGVASPRSWDSWGFARSPADPEAPIQGFEGWCADTYFGGEAYPNLWVNLGPGIMAAYLGASPRFISETMWFETPRTWSDLQHLSLDPEDEWWRTTKRITSRAVEAAAGRFFVGITDLGGILDIAASLRGSKNLVMDLHSSPDLVKHLSAQILPLWHRCYEELHAMIQMGMSGSSAWMGIWSPRRWYPIQCDFSAMLSPTKFREIALPYLRHQCRRLDNTIYHLDGPGEIPHLDLLLSIPELDGIQWTPGAGQPGVDSPTWFPIYKKIQARDKLLVLLDAAEENVEYLLRQISPGGLLIRSSCSSEKEARGLLEKMKTWTARG